jgi:outer membrane receptor protein involved in Fe transport
MLYWWSQDGGGFENPSLSFTNDEFLAEQTHFYASGEYRFRTIPVKTTLSYHFMVDNAFAHFQSFLDFGDNPPPLGAFTFQDDRLNVVNLQVDYFPSFIDNYFLAGIGMRDTRIGEPTFTGLSPADVTPGQPVSLVGRYLYPPRGYFSNLRPFLGQNRIYVYAQDQQYLWDKRIEITAGLRFDHHSIYGNILNVRSGLVVRPVKNYAIRAAFGQGFREPTLFELSDNPSLSPARMNTWEVSFLFTPVANLSGQIAYYQNRASKLIVLERGAGANAARGGGPQNVGEKRVGGIETLLRYQVGRLGGDLWYSYEYPLDDQPLLGTARHKLGFGPRYGFGDHYSVAVRGKWTSGAHGQALDATGSISEISVPQYFTMDLTLLAHSLTFAGCKADVSFQILNILGRTNYYVNTVGPNPNRYLAEGREFFGKASLNF